MIGTLLNQRYRLDAELGRGGMGVVYRARDTLLHRDVAVKVLSSTALGTEGRAHMLHEARAVAQLNHPNVVSVHDAGESEGSSFIVMELLEGESLLDRKPGSLDETLSIARQICAALEHAHAHGIVHRDLKPENVMLVRGALPSSFEGEGPGVRVKLADFGLARTPASRLTTEGTILGTVAYLAPEQAMGERLDHRADLYALGVMLYELTTGRLPFAGDDPLSVISQHLYAPVVPPRALNPRIPPLLDALVVRLLSKSPDGRPASAAEVRETLAGLASGVGLPVPVQAAEELSVLDRIVRGRMVGREQELAQAKEVWRQAAAGAGQVLLVSGEPGIGKTRLVRELSAQVQVSGGRVLVGACYAEGSLPYAPVAQMLRTALEGDSGGDLNLPEFVLGDLLTLAPALRLRCPQVAPDPLASVGASPTLDDPRTERHRLFQSLVLFVTALSERAPLLLVLEDTHWADSGTLALLRHLARHTRRGRVLIVATYREVELDEALPLHEMLLDLQRERLATRLKLTRLDRSQTEALLEVLFAEEITPEFAEGIYRETEGNPFYVEEVCKALVESGKLNFQDGRWQRPSIEELGIPQSVRVAIQSRVRALSAGAQETLRLAAVLGREFDLDTLVAAGDQDEDALIDALESAERAHLIEEVSGEGGGRFAFVHGLIASTLAESARTLRRRRLHRRAAAAIEVLRPDDLEALAYHYSQAGQAEKAVGYLLQAGDRARGLYAHREAIDHYRQALEVLEEMGDTERAARTLMKLGLTHHNAFDFKAAHRAYERGFILWQRAAETGERVPRTPAPHALRLPMGTPTTLDPALVAESTSVAVTDQLFSGLVELSPEMNVVPDVAHRWEMLDGGRKYVFHLRDDVRWSDGVPVTARDFEFAWKRVLDPASGSPSADILYDIRGAQAYHQDELADPDRVGVRALDEFTLLVELEGPTAHFLHLLAYSTTLPVPRHVVKAHGARWTERENLVTNGPFRLVSWGRDKPTVLERYPTYHGRFTGNLQRVELFRPKEPARSFQMYEEDDLDIIFLTSLPPAGQDRARQQYAGEYVLVPELHTLYVGFDVNRPPFDDRRVRRAFALATDKEMLADLTLRGFYAPATGGLVPPGMPGHSPGIGLPYDPEGARQLLAEAGYAGGRSFPPLDALAGGSSADTIAEFLQAQWLENLGMEIAWKMIEWRRLLDRVSGRTPHMWFARGWAADYPDPDSFLRASLWRVRTGWQDKVYDGLVEGARRVMDQEERMRICQRADGILVDAAPILLLLYGRSHLLIKPWVKRYPTSPLRSHFWKDVVIEPH